MRLNEVSRIATAIVLSHVVSFVTAHSDEHDMTMTMAMVAAAPSQPTQPVAPQPDQLVSYFAHGAHTGSMIAHIGLMVLAWVVILPIGMCGVDGPC